MRLNPHILPFPVRQRPVDVYKRQSHPHGATSMNSAWPCKAPMRPPCNFSRPAFSSGSWLPASRTGCTPASVSYTHLDVYKRQGLNPGPGYPIQNLQTIFCGLQVLLLRRLPQPASTLSLNPTAVSYTHLDVYKRQPMYSSMAPRLPNGPVFPW